MLPRDGYCRTHDESAKGEPAERRARGVSRWTLDAFDFFILTLIIDDIAKAFGKSRPDIALALTLTLAMRPFGAVVFGLMAIGTADGSR